jgi:hypothetical protein
MILAMPVILDLILIKDLIDYRLHIPLEILVGRAKKTSWISFIKLRELKRFHGKQIRLAAPKTPSINDRSVMSV